MDAGSVLKESQKLVGFQIFTALESTPWFLPQRYRHHSFVEQERVARRKWIPSAFFHLKGIWKAPTVQMLVHLVQTDSESLQRGGSSWNMWLFWQAQNSKAGYQPLLPPSRWCDMSGLSHLHTLVIQPSARSGTASETLQLNHECRVHRLSWKQSCYVRGAEEVCPDVSSLQANLYWQSKSF